MHRHWLQSNELVLLFTLMLTLSFFCHKNNAYCGKGSKILKTSFYIQKLKTREMKIASVTVPKVDRKFVHAYLAIENIPLEALQLFERNSKNHIGNRNILGKIQTEYEKFRNSNVTLAQYFNRDVIIGKISRSGQYCNVNVSEITKLPLILATNYDGKFFHGVQLSDIRATGPIKMDSSLIYIWNGMNGRLNHADIPPNVEVYEVQNKLPIRNEFTPGQSNFRNPILIGYDENSEYWITHRDMVKTQFTCKKFPGKCLYKTTDLSNYNRHQETCTDETIVTTKQVKLINYDQ